jgi:2-polyprenyl-3-methyl-5-hydroxy-6-metoxy-1,4-benzoquinol methylase
MTTISDRNSSITFGYNFSQSRMKKVVEIFNNLPGSGSFLDIGAAQGDLLLYMQNLGWRVSGIDLNEENVRICKSNGLEVDLCDLSITSIPHTDRSVDLIFAGEIIEHLVDTDKFIIDIFRCLRPGGQLVLTTPNLASLENRARILFGIYPEWVDFCTSEGCGHVRAYTKKVLKRQLEKHGFIVEKVLGDFIPIAPVTMVNDIKLPFLGIGGYYFPTLSQCLIVQASKPSQTISNGR